ncbi:MAG: hypothetical protein ACR2NN_13485 [Bryobacteraceae bacterium]
MEDRVDKLESRMDRAERLLERTALVMLEVAEAQKHTEDRLGGVVQMMDEWIRNRRNGS